MIHTVALVLLAGYAVAAPQFASPQQYSTNQVIPIVSQTQEGPNLDGSYNWSYQTGNGISAQEQGYVQNFGAGEPNEIQTAQGGYSYTAPDGQVISLTYTAGKEGFVAQGSHIPTPPPIPPEIQRALEFIASQPQKYDDNGNPIGGAQVTRIQPNQRQYGK